MHGDVSTAGRSVGSEVEALFSIEELFFSRTDLRGRIIAGNSVFQRVSQYSWEELLERPHNVIRHPDMPRGVFWLLWDRIRSGMPIGAYVKNRSKNGGYYWVYAIVTPVEGGYLSVRLKPTSALLSVVEAEYGKLRDAEAAQKLSPADSAQLLLTRLPELGYRDYVTFMGGALTREILERQRAMGTEADPVLGLFDQLASSAQSLLDTAARVFEGYRSHRFVPLNLLVQAGRLGGAGAAIGMISSNYSILSDEIRVGMDDFMKAAREVATVISESAFLVGTAKIQEEIIDVFQGEAGNAGSRRENEMSLLDKQHSAYRQQALESLRSIQRLIEKFHHETLTMKRLASGLAAIRVMGKVESGRLSVGVLNDLINDLEKFQQLIVDGLSRIDAVNQTIRDASEHLLLSYGKIGYVQGTG